MDTGKKLKAEVELKNTHINEYYEELSSDLTVTIYNIREKALSVSAIRSKWLMYLFKEREQLKRMKDVKSIAMKKYLDVANRDPARRSSINKKLEDEINETNEKMVALNRKIEQTKEVVQFIEYGTNILNDFGWVIKNTIEAVKLEQV